MSKQIKDIIKVIKKLDIEKIWKDESIVYGKYRYSKDGDIKVLKAPVKLNRLYISSNHRGFYGWFTDENIQIYAGKTERNINSRQREHRKAFKNKNDQSESSGRKLRELIHNMGVDYLDITIRYIDISQFDYIPGLSLILESASIEYYKPILNSEIYGYGAR